MKHFICAEIALLMALLALVPGVQAEDTHSEEHVDGQVKIDSGMAARFGLEVEPVGPADIIETIRTYGRIRPDPTLSLNVKARFSGVIRSVPVQLGDRVKTGTVLAIVESDDSLQSYSVTAPGPGIILSRHANPGEQTDGRTLFRIVDPSRVWVELKLFPSQRNRVRVGQQVRLVDASGEQIGEGEIDWIGIEIGADQSVDVRVRLPNAQGRLVAGMHVTGDVIVATHSAALAVLRTGLQDLRGKTVVFVRSGDVYAARVLTLGRQDGERVEVVAGLRPGERYVSANSYLIKADIEKDSASHDH